MVFILGLTWFKRLYILHSINDDDLQFVGPNDYHYYC